MALVISMASHQIAPGKPINAFSVRKEAKKHGRRKLVEGNFKAGDNVVVVDDVITTGGSTLKAIESIEAEGHPVFATFTRSMLK
ncbi:MAG: orotate phosphoribosyltransferase [Verrucomicrobiota bacterium]